MPQYDLPKLPVLRYNEEVDFVRRWHEMNFAVIDTETTWDDEVMTIGVVIADGNSQEIIGSRYFLLNPEYKKPAMYSGTINMPGIKDIMIDSRAVVMIEIEQWLKRNGVGRILAYNASFDKGHLPELNCFEWCDIMRLAAYRQYNNKISPSAECFKTGRLKHGYGVEAILRMIGNNKSYYETHNAYYDALDELSIVQLLGHDLRVYDVAVL